MLFTEFGILISFSHLHLQNAWSPISIKEFGNTTDSNSFFFSIASDLDHSVFFSVDVNFFCDNEFF